LQQAKVNPAIAGEEPGVFPHRLEAERFQEEGWKIHRSTADDVKAFAQRYNATVRGWIEYYGKFWYWNFSYRLWSAFQSRLVKWACAKYRISQRMAERRLARLRRKQPRLFAHWYLLRAANVRPGAV